MSDSTQVEALDASYCYPGSVAALQHISLRLVPGDRLALIGLNGSGKTTLAKCMAGLLKPDSGQILLNDQEIHSVPPGKLAARIGFVFQNPDHQIFKPSVREEIAFGLENLGIQGQALEERVGEVLADYDLEAQALKPPAILSYGLRRKVSVAAVAAMKPDILVLDEPTLGLDWGSATEMLDRLFGQIEGAGSVVFVSHDLRLVGRYARETALLDQGRLIKRQRTDQLFQDNELLERHGLKTPPLTRLAAAIGVHEPATAFLQVEALAKVVVQRLEASP